MTAATSSALFQDDEYFERPIEEKDQSDDSKEEEDEDGEEQEKRRRQEESRRHAKEQEEREKREVEQETGEQLIRAASKGDLRECEDIFQFAETESLNIINVRLPGLPGSDPGTYITDGTALMVACRHGHDEVVSYLLERGADVELFERDQKRTALLLAAEGNHFEVLRILKTKANHSSTDIHGRTALILAASKGSHQAVEQLLWDSDINAVDESGYSALTHASREGHFKIAKKLCDFAADLDVVDKARRTPLLHAARLGHVDVVKMLLDRGADIDRRDKLGWTSVMLAARWNKVHVVELLVANGADLSFRERRNGMDALMLAVSKTRNPALVRALIEKSDLDAVDVFGRTAKDLAVGVEIQAIVQDALDARQAQAAKESDSEQDEELSS